MALEAREQPEARRRTLTNRVQSYSAEQRRLAKDYAAIKERGMSERGVWVVYGWSMGAVRVWYGYVGVYGP